MARIAVREYVVTVDRRSHQARKPGTVIPVRKLERRRVPKAGSTAICVCHSQRHRHRGAARLRTFEGVEPMGRGRAKAKQVKVARQLKYNGGGTDLNRLRQELGVGTEAQSADHDDPYAEYDDEDALDDDAGDEDDDEEDDWSR